MFGPKLVSIKFSFLHVLQFDAIRVRGAPHGKGDWRSESLLVEAME